MDRLTLEEMQRRLAEIPAEQFGCGHKNCAIGQLHYVMTGKRSFGFDGNVFPPDVARAVAILNDNLHPEDRKSLAMMLPLPEAFPELTPERARKLILWAGDKALGFYDGTDQGVLEKAIDSICTAAYEAYHFEADWREWMAEYLTMRTEA